MSCTVPTPRQVGNALAVLLALPPAVLQVLAERIVDRLDALDGDPDAEPDAYDEADQDDEAAEDEDGATWAFQGKRLCRAIKAKITSSPCLTR